MKNEMKVLKSLVENADNECFKDIAVVHINHCMSNSFYFNDILSSTFYKLFFVVPPYNNRVPPSDAKYDCYYASLNDGKYDFIENGEVFYSKNTDFYNASLTLIKAVFEREIIDLAKKGRKIIIIEDGGYHYTVVKELCREHSELKNSIIGCVEQTTSGTKNSYKFCCSTGFDYPVLSIARSNLKMRFESIFIARRVVEELNNILYKLNTFIPFHNILLIGYGNIGRNIAKCLSNMYCSIGVYDTNKDIASLAQKEGHKKYDVITKDVFTHNTIVLGNVGQPSFTNDMLEAFFESEAESMILGSSSSKDIEFSYFIDVVKGKEKLPENAELLDQYHQNNYSEYTFSFNGVQKTIVLLANGMPLNLYREDVDSLTFSVIDIVFSEIFMLVSYIAKKNKNIEYKVKFLGLDNELEEDFAEDDLISKWFNIYGYCKSLDNCNLQNVFEKHPMEDILRLMNMF